MFRECFLAHMSNVCQDTQGHQSATVCLGTSLHQSKFFPIKNIVAYGCLMRNINIWNLTEAGTRYTKDNGYCVSSDGL